MIDLDSSCGAHFDDDLPACVPIRTGHVKAHASRMQNFLVLIMQVTV